MLQEKSLLNDTFQETPFLVVFDADSTAGRMFIRRVEGQVLDFETLGDGKMRDRQTGSRWEASRGVCLEGSLVGKQLPPVPAIVSFARAWKRFHPDSR